MRLFKNHTLDLMLPNKTLSSPTSHEDINANHNLNKHDHAYGACIISKDQFKCIPIRFPEEFENNMAGIEIKHENISLCFVSLYRRPSARNQENLIKTAIHKLGLQLPNAIIAIDINERNKYGEAALKHKSATH